MRVRTPAYTHAHPSILDCIENTSVLAGLVSVEASIPRIFPIESLAYDGGHTLVHAEGISKYQQVKKKSAATALNTVRASAHTQTAQ
jgi:hypothetical protein